MIFVSILVFLLQGALTSMAHEKRFDMKSSAKQGWLKGFQKAISGEVLHYHSPLPMVESALLVRSMDRSALIEWETEPIPVTIKDEYVTFMWMAGIDVNEDSQPFRLYIDDREWFTFSNPRDTLKKVWQIEGRGGSELGFKMTMIDKYDDFMGYVFLKLPRAELQAGKPLLIRVEGESAGSCKNYFTIQRWVDISNQDHGITWVTRDAPLIEVGSITSDPIAVGWKRRVEPGQTLYSYVMNNYWETNYKASQEGPSTFRYAIRPHGSFNSGSAERFGIEWSQPLYAFPGAEKSPPRGSFLSVDPIGVIVTSLKPSEDGKAIMVRLFNAGGRPERVKLQWGQQRPRALYLSSPFEEQGQILKGPVECSAYRIMTLRAEKFN